VELYIPVFPILSSCLTLLRLVEHSYKVGGRTSAANFPLLLSVRTSHLFASCSDDDEHASCNSSAGLGMVGDNHRIDRSVFSHSRLCSMKVALKGSCCCGEKSVVAGPQYDMMVTRHPESDTDTLWFSSIDVVGEHNNNIALSFFRTRHKHIYSYDS